MAAAEIESQKPGTWAESAGQFVSQHSGEILLGAATAALAIAGRGKILECAEGLLPKLGSFIEEGAAADGSIVKQVGHATAEEVKTLHFDIDPAKVAETFGTNVKALPSMSVTGGQVEQRIALVDANSALAKTYEEVEPSIFSLHDLRGDKEVKIGTAFLTEDNYLATAQHCAAGKSNLFVRIAGGERLPVSVAAKDMSADVALLKFNAPVENLPPPLKLGWASSLKPTDQVRNFGYPAQSNRLVFTEGPVKELEARRIWTGTEERTDLAPILAPSVKIQSRALGFGGSSGGPLMADGEVVGVHVSPAPDTVHGRATAIEHVRLLLDQVRKNPVPLDGLDVKSIGRVLGKGNTFTVKVEQLNVSLGDAIEKP
jgi:S1-C subfamily serine protease